MEGACRAEMEGANSHNIQLKSILNLIYLVLRMDNRTNDGLCLCWVDGQEIAHYKGGSCMVSA